ncbi:MAG: hypothetical protein ACPGSD_01035 [Flavobacteriales bacterium]
MAIIHLIMILIKITLLSTFYSSIFLLFFHKFNFKKVAKIVKGIIRMKSFPKVYPIIWISLLAFQFTYFGDTGMGDSAKIPLGHWKTIDNVDWTTSYVEINKNKSFIIHKYYLDGNIFYGEIQVNPFEKKTSGYLIWNLKTNEYEHCKLRINNETCSHLTRKINLELMKSFDDQYSAYWGGWKFWF